MIRQTGGLAVGEISTRSSPFVLAIDSACGGGMMPSCCPVSSITRISRTRMRSLTRVRSSRRGLLSKAIKASLRYVLAGRCERLALGLDFRARGVDELLHGASTQIAARPGADRYRSLGRLAVP